MEWYIFKVIIFCRFLNFYFVTAMYFTVNSNAQVFFLSLNSYNPLSKIYRHSVGFFAQSCQIYVLSAKNHELGYSLTFNNSVVSKPYLKPGPS